MRDQRRSKERKEATRVVRKVEEKREIVRDRDKAKIKKERV